MFLYDTYCRCFYPPAGLLYHTCKGSRTVSVKELNTHPIPQRDRIPSRGGCSVFDVMMCTFTFDAQNITPNQKDLYTSMCDTDTE